LKFRLARGLNFTQLLSICTILCNEACKDFAKKVSSLLFFNVPNLDRLLLLAKNAKRATRLNNRYFITDNKKSVISFSLLPRASVEKVKLQKQTSSQSRGVSATKHGKVYLLTGKGCVMAMGVGRRRGRIDERLRRRRRRPLFVGRRGVRMMRRVVRRVVAEAACTTQQQASVARRHVMMVVLVHGPGRRREIRLIEWNPEFRGRNRNPERHTLKAWKIILRSKLDYANVYNVTEILYEERKRERGGWEKQETNI